MAKIYSKDSFVTSFPNNEILNAFADAYKNNYFQKTKELLVEYIKNQITSLNGNKQDFLNALELTGCNDVTSISLPTYVELANYNGKTAWVIQLLWGVEASNLGHYKCFAIDVDRKDTLNFIRCY